MRIVAYLCIILFGSSLFTHALAVATSELQHRLNKITRFHAKFSQKVIDPEGANVQQGSGELWVKRPDLFHWHMAAPDESIIVSDGKTVWFYNPFVEQVTATWLKDATNNTPFMLIARNNQSSWQQYNIIQQGDDFLLTPKRSASNFQQFAVNVTTNGEVTRFSSTAQDGQRTVWTLENLPHNTMVDDKFSFTLPKGVTLDDQRR